MHTPAVRRLVLSYGFCAIGSAMVAVATAFIAFRESGSVVLTVVVLGANAAPALILSPLVGRVATREAAIHHPHLGLHIFSADLPGAFGHLFHPADDHHDNENTTAHLVSAAGDHPAP